MPSDARWISFVIGPDYWSVWHFAVLNQQPWCHLEEVPQGSHLQDQRKRPPEDKCCPTCTQLFDEALVRQDLVLMPDGGVELTDQGRSRLFNLATA